MSPMEVKTSNSLSYGWRSILATQNLLREGLKRTIGSEDNTRVWMNPWIPVSPARPANDTGIYRDPNLLVSHLINPVTHQWKSDILKR